MQISINSLSFVEKSQLVSKSKIASTFIVCRNREYFSKENPLLVPIRVIISDISIFFFFRSNFYILKFVPRKLFASGEKQQFDFPSL